MALLRERRDRGAPRDLLSRVVILSPSKYVADGYVERFRWGFMPNIRVRHRSCGG